MWENEEKEICDELWMIDIHVNKHDWEQKILIESIVKSLVTFK